MVQFLLSSSVAFRLFWSTASFIVLLLPFIFPFCAFVALQRRLFRSPLNSFLAIHFRNKILFANLSPPFSVIVGFVVRCI